MRTQLICELATSHGGDLFVAEDMIRAAADSGADFAKVQSYSLDKLNPADPQADWLKQAHLDEAAHVRLMEVCRQSGIKFLSTPFDVDSLALLRRLGMDTFKIASSEAARGWWRHDGFFIVSWPWGKQVDKCVSYSDHSSWVAMHHLTAIPLYPTPLECVEKATLLDGWSDHTAGLSACQRAIVLGAKMIEVHLTLPGRSRQMAWDKTPADVRKLRTLAEDCATMSSGVSEVYRTRWSA